MRIEIFDGEVDELAAALKLLVPQLSSSNPPPEAAEIREMLASDAITQFVARDDDGRIVGVSTLAVFPIPTARRAWIEDVIVDEPSNGQGVGTELTKAMIDHARSLGCKTVELTSRPSREAANHMYRKLGFVPRDTNIYRYQFDA
jgi:ribosomal protein S18 acetylase RimI-like enzyme